MMLGFPMGMCLTAVPTALVVLHQICFAGYLLGAPEITFVSDGSGDAFKNIAICTTMGTLSAFLTIYVISYQTLLEGFYLKQYKDLVSGSLLGVSDDSVDDTAEKVDVDLEFGQAQEQAACPYTTYCTCPFTGLKLTSIGFVTHHAPTPAAADLQTV